MSVRNLYPAETTALSSSLPPNRNATLAPHSLLLPHSQACWLRTHLSGCFSRFPCSIRRSILASFSRRRSLSCREKAQAGGNRTAGLAHSAMIDAANAGGQAWEAALRDSSHQPS